MLVENNSIISYSVNFSDAKTLLIAKYSKFKSLDLKAYSILFL